MVNVFGDNDGVSGLRGARGPVGPVGPEGEEGPRGPRGEKGDMGPSGLEELCKWLPDFTLRELQKTESCCYFFPRDGSGYEKSGSVIEKMLSHSTHPALLDHSVDAVAVEKKGCNNTIPISHDRFALRFEGDMLYRGTGIQLVNPNHAWVCLCVTFQVTAQYDQWIVSTGPSGGDSVRAVTATPSKIRVWGCDDDEGPPFVEISYPKSSWVTIMVEWSNRGDRIGSVNVNNGQSLTEFTCKELDPTKVINDIVIGARCFSTDAFEATMHMQGDFAALEVYASKDEKSRLPNCMKNSIIQNQMVSTTTNTVDHVNKPPIKRKKMS